MDILLCDAANVAEKQDGLTNIRVSFAEFRQLLTVLEVGIEYASKQCHVPAIIVAAFRPSWILVLIDTAENVERVSVHRTELC